MGGLQCCSGGTDLVLEVPAGHSERAVQVHVDVIVSLHHQLRLPAELTDPEVTHHALEGEVPVGVEDVPLHDVLVPPGLHLEAALQGSLPGPVREAEHEGQPRPHRGNTGPAPGGPDDVSVLLDTRSHAHWTLEGGGSHPVLNCTGHYHYHSHVTADVGVYHKPEVLLTKGALKGILTYINNMYLYVYFSTVW